MTPEKYYKYPNKLCDLIAEECEVPPGENSKHLLFSALKTCFTFSKKALDNQQANHYGHIDHSIITSSPFVDKGENMNEKNE